MNRVIFERVLSESSCIIETSKTIREIASIYNVSKSTVHKDLHERLREINYSLFMDVDKILQNHASIRHIRGGESTRIKYQKIYLLNSKKE